PDLRDDVLDELHEVLGAGRLGGAALLRRERQDDLDAAAADRADDDVALIDRVDAALQALGQLLHLRRVEAFLRQVVGIAGLEFALALLGLFQVEFVDEDGAAGEVDAGAVSAEEREGPEEDRRHQHDEQAAEE